LLVIFLMNSLWKSWAKEGGISKVELFYFSFDFNAVFRAINMF
jgi:hypothetical protein